MEKSKLTEDKKVKEPILYSPQEKLYLTNLQNRLSRARDARDTPRVEFDGMTYGTYCEENRKLANSFIKPKLNKEDSNYQSGTVRKKMLDILAALNNLDLGPDVNAFDKSNIEVAGFGQSLEDINWKTEELDGDEEKKMLRQYTMMEQGTVFCNEDWIEKVGIKKTISKPFDGSTAEWGHRLEKVFEGASRDIIQNEKVYLGDLTVFDIKEQPYIFTTEVVPYDVAEQIYGQWTRWKHVDCHRVHFMNNERDESTLYNSNWLLSDIEDNQVEIIKYQDKPGNEYQIIINSVPMLPLGFPMPWKHGEYSLVKQIYSIISAQFAYGKSFPATTRLQIAVWDEMLKLMVLKTQKSFKPPMANNTGKNMSSRVLMPSVITTGVDPTKLTYIDPEGSRGINQGEVAAMNIIRQNLDELTVNPVFSGQNPEGKQTATQIVEVQRQARLMLGLTIFVASMLEKKLSELRMMNILEHWFDPMDDTFDAQKQTLVPKYRTFARRVPIGGQGMGQRIVRVVDENKSAYELFKEEEKITEETGIPTRIAELNATIIRASRYALYVTIVAREKRTGPAAKLMFREFLLDLQLFDKPEAGLIVDWGYVASRFATNWEENPERIFKQVDPATMVDPTGEGANPTPQPQSRGRAKVNVNVGAPVA